MTWWPILTNGLWIGGLSLLLAAVSYHLWLAADSGTPRRQLLRAPSWRWPWATGVFLITLGWALSMASAPWEKLVWFGLAAGSALQLMALFARQPRRRTALVPEVCLVAAKSPTLTVFMAPHIQALSQHYRVTLVSSGPQASLAPLLQERVGFEQVEIGRDIAPLGDLRSLFALWRLFRRRPFTVVHSITPKAGLLTMMAGCLAGVPVRIHWFTGQIWATKTGSSRWLLKTLDRLLVMCATDLLADSQSQRQFLVDERVVREGQVTVLEHGSVCGVDTSRFRPDPSARASTRAELSIPEWAVVSLFVGRVTRDKGILELAQAFAEAALSCPTLYLVIVGPDEQGLNGSVQELTRDVESRVRRVDFTSEPERFMAAADVFVLPSYREGFGSSVIEAAACGVPTIGSRIYGLTDAIEEGVSGLLVPVADPVALTRALVTLTREAPARLAMGRRARTRVEEYFDQARLADALVQFYRARSRTSEVS